MKVDKFINKIILIFILFGCMQVQAQKINPYAGIEYFIDYGYTYRQSVIEQIPLLPKIYTLKNNKPQAITGLLMAGFEFEIFKNLKSDIRIETLTAHDDGLKFRPLQTDYTFALKYQFKQFIFKYEHKCTHPTKSMEFNQFEMYGSYDKIGVYWRLRD